MELLIFECCMQFPKKFSRSHNQASVMSTSKVQNQNNRESLEDVSRKQENDVDISMHV